MKTLLSGFAIIVMLSSCARSVTRIDPNQSMDLSGRWNDTDSRMIADKMITNLLGSEKFKEYSTSLGKKPAIIVGVVKNKTSEHIDSDNYTKKMELAILTPALPNLWSRMNSGPGWLRSR